MLMRDGRRDGRSLIYRNPTISIIIPTHNRPLLVKRAVESALAGAGDFSEIIVVDDGTLKAKTPLEDLLTDPRLKLITNDGPKGASSARNTGAKAAKGTALLFLDDDDEIVIGYPSRVCELVCEQKSLWGFASHRVRSDQHESSPPSCRRNLHVHGLARDDHKFRLKIAGLGSGFWIDRELFLKIRGLCVDQSTDEDTDICCRLLGMRLLPWIENEIAVVIDRTSDVERLTAAVTASSSAENYLRTYKRNIGSCRNLKGAEAFLAIRAQRMILRSNRQDMLPILLDDISNFPLKSLLWFKRHGVIAAVALRWRTRSCYTGLMETSREENDHDTLYRIRRIAQRSFDLCC